MSEPDIWHLPLTTVAVAREIDPVAWAALEKIEAVSGVPDGEAGSWTMTFCRMSYQNWQDRVAFTLGVAPAIIKAHWQAHLECQHRRMFSWRDMVPWHNPSGRLPVIVDP